MSGLSWAIAFIQDCLLITLKGIIGSILIGGIMLIPAFLINHFSKSYYKKRNIDVF